MFHSIAPRLFAATALVAALSGGALAAGDLRLTAGDLRFTAEQSYPEGIAWSAPHKRFFVSSIHQGVIGQVSLNGHYTPFIRDDKLVSSVGLQFDAKRNLVWAAVGDLGNSVRSSAATQGKLAALAAYDASTGERRAYHDLGHLVDGAHFANDLALDDRGQVYVTDSFSPVIYRVDAQGTASVFVRSEWFTGEGFNLNGIVWHPDGYLLVNKHNSGELFRINTQGTPEIRRVVLPEALKGADGLLLLAANRLAVVQNSGADRVVELVSHDGWQSASLVSARKTAGSFPTTAARVGKGYYVLNSRLDTLMTPDAPRVSDYLLQKQ
jgi:sugar lactone lactonase YvrE